MFSDAPVPDVEAAIVVAHPGDEAVSVSWLMARLQNRASVYCLTLGSHGCPGGLNLPPLHHVQNGGPGATKAAAALAGVPQERCHNLGLQETELARDLETLVWLTTAAVSADKPRLLVTHACEGKSLDHDATAFAVHMAARMMARSGGAPLVVEVPRHLAGDDSDEHRLALAHQAVRIEFGPESRKVKRRMMQCHCDTTATIDSGSLQSESYLLAQTGNPLDVLTQHDGAYLDAPWCQLADFRREARDVAAALTLAVLSTPSRA
jgi:LmbE family N-acetylglucosaminyl deacetylase